MDKSTGDGACRQYARRPLFCSSYGGTSVTRGRGQGHQWPATGPRGAIKAGAASPIAPRGPVAGRWPFYGRGSRTSPAIDDRRAVGERSARRRCPGGLCPPGRIGQGAESLRQSERPSARTILPSAELCASPSRSTTRSPGTPSLSTGSFALASFPDDARPIWGLSAESRSRALRPELLRRSRAPRLASTITPIVTASTASPIRAGRGRRRPAAGRPGGMRELAQCRGGGVRRARRPLEAVRHLPLQAGAAPPLRSDRARGRFRSAAPPQRRTGRAGCRTG